MKNLFIHFAAVVCFLVAASAGARGLLVSPSQIGLIGRPGEVVSETIYVSSSREEQNFVQVAVTDFTRDENGQVREIAAAEAARSCRAWIEVDRNNFTSPEQGRVQLSIRARIPEQAVGSYWALVTLKSVPPPRQRDGAGHGFRIVPRVAIPVIITVVGGERREIKIADLKIVSATDRAIEVEAVLENRGNVAVLFSGAFTLNTTEADGRVIELAEAPVETVMSLPGTRSLVRRRIEWNGRSTGLRVESIFRFGPGAGEVAEAAVSVETRG